MSRHTAPHRRLDALDGVGPLTDPELGPYVPFAALPTDCPNWARTEGRMDPYYSQLWHSAASASWQTKRTTREAMNQGRGNTQRMQRRVSPIDPVHLFRNQRTSTFVKDTFAATLMWRTVTSDQLAAITGHKIWLGHRGDSTPLAVDRMISAAMVKIGSLPKQMGFRPPTLMGPGTLTSWDSLNEVLTMPQWLSITAGQSKDATSSGALWKHDVGTTELCLRLAQWAPIAGVVGSGCARHEDLVPQIVGLDHVRHGKYASADAVIVTEDGRSIALEMTVGKFNAEKKVRRWSQTLSYATDDRVSVLFMVARSPGAPRDAGRQMRRMMRNELEAVRASTGLDFRHRFFIADWEQWFPQAGMVTSQIASMPVQRWTGDDWEWTHLLTQDHAAHLTPGTLAFAEARMSIGAMSMLRGVPFWMRDEELGADMLARMEVANVARYFPDQMPVLPYTKAEGRPDRSTWLHPGDVLSEPA